MRIVTGLLAGILCMTAAFAESELFSFEFEELAPGVWVGVRPDSPRFPVMGNTTFVIGDNGVVVFDGGGMPAMAEQIIAKIRSLTDKPVTHVVISHWHGDHNFGVYRFAEEYSDVQIIAHEFTNEVFHSSKITYVDRQYNYIVNNVDEFQKIAETGVDSKGEEHSEADRRDYRLIVADAEELKAEFSRARVTPANVTFTDKYTIQSGSRTIELLHLGHANTAGDIVMWLPDEGIVATGDIVVLPSPYAFNVPPRAWAETLRELNKLEYKKLVPGHGAVQTDTAYVDLIIEAAESIADQRDTMLADGMSVEDVEANLDFSAFEKRFTQDDDYVKNYYDAYFEVPFRAAAMKALTDEPMVALDPPERVAFDDGRWRIEAQESELLEYLGEQALRIKGGAALLPDLDVENGMVEFDIAVSEKRGFAGLIFRVQDNDNFEHFYIRPHQSGNPDANQYTPVFNGVSAWQLYHGEGYGTPVNYRFDEWMHVRIVFAGSQAKVYIDSDEPVLHITDLKRKDDGGGIGLHSANFSAVHFANFEMTPLANAYAFPSVDLPASSPDSGLVTTWDVSDAFSASWLDGVIRLDEQQMSEREWINVSAEATGITNLATVQGIGDGEDTVFARLRVSSDVAEVRQLLLGYSDRVAVYVNNELVYKGDNTYMSRDYRYLGTIGLFDGVTLPLKAGENEICIAVSEAFGGWGIMAKLTDLE